MRNFRTRFAVLLTGIFLAFFYLGSNALAATGEINFVETDVDLSKDGSVDIEYVVQWRVISGEFHGFYFQPSEPLEVISSASFASDESGKTYDIEFTKESNRVKVALAENRGVSSGKVTFTYWYSTNLFNAGYVAPTTSPEGRKLVVFNWAPAQWDEASNQEHYTLSVLTPFVLPAGVDPRAYVEQNQLILTEKFMNEDYLIDYQRGAKDRLLLVFHRNQPGNLYHMQAQFYMPAEWFSLPAEVPSDYKPGQGSITTVKQDQGSSPFGSGAFAIGAIMLQGIFMMVSRTKQRSMVSAKVGLSELRWENINWTPPKLILSDFRVAGKACTDLTSLEAAFYLEIPFKDIVSAMLQSFINEGYMMVARENPLTVKIIAEPVYKKLDVYEQEFFDAIKNDGVLDQAELEDLMNAVVRSVQQKAWDCDIEATQKHYRSVIDTFEKQQRAALVQQQESLVQQQGQEPREYDDWYWWYHNSNPNYRHFNTYATNP